MYSNICGYGDKLIQTNTNLIINKMREKLAWVFTSKDTYHICVRAHTNTQKKSKKYLVYLIKKVSLPLGYLANHTDHSLDSLLD